MIMLGRRGTKKRVGMRRKKKRQNKIKNVSGKENTESDPKGTRKRKKRKKGTMVKEWVNDGT